MVCASVPFLPNVLSNPKSCHNFISSIFDIPSSLPPAATYWSVTYIYSSSFRDNFPCWYCFFVAITFWNLVNVSALIPRSFMATLFSPSRIYFTVCSTSTPPLEYIPPFSMDSLLIFANASLPSMPA